MSQNIEEAVKQQYGAVATSGLSSAHAGVRAERTQAGSRASPYNDLLANRGDVCGLRLGLGHTSRDNRLIE